MTDAVTATVTTDPREARRLAREAKVAAAAAAEAKARVHAEAAVGLLLDERAGCPPRGVGSAARSCLSLALGAAARAAAETPGLTATARRILTEADGGPLYGVLGLGRGVDTIPHGRWARQGGFLRTTGELRVGSYAYGVNGRPRETLRGYALLFVTVGNRTCVLDSATESEAGGADAAGAVAEVWGEVAREADRREAAELASAAEIAQQAAAEGAHRSLVAVETAHRALELDGGATLALAGEAPASPALRALELDDTARVEAEVRTGERFAGLELT